MEHFLNPSVGDIVYVKRKDREGEMDIPLSSRNYVGNEYGYFARVVKVIINESYHRVKPLGDESLKTRKAAKSKIFRALQA